MSIRVLFIDNVKPKVEHLIVALNNSGFEVKFSNNYSKCIADAEKFQPHVVIVNLIVEGKSALPIIRSIKARLADTNPKIIVATAQKSLENIRSAVKAGANDFLIDPVDPKVLMDRLTYQLQERDQYDIEKIQEHENTNCTKSFYFVYDTIRILSETPQTQVALHHCLKRLSDETNSPRVNIMIGDLEQGTGSVIASSDDPKLMNIDIDLDRYNEVREVLLNGGIIYIKDINQNPLTQHVQELVKTVSIQSLLVFPIRHRGQTVGTLSIRLSYHNDQEGQAQIKAIEDTEIKTYYMVAQLLGSKVAARKLVKQSSNI